MYRRMPTYVCERTFAQPLSTEAFGEGGKVLGPCLEARNVRWITSHLAADGMRSVCLFDAEDAEAVRDANRTAGIPFDRVWAAQTFDSK